MKKYIFDYDYEKTLFGSIGERILSMQEKKILDKLIGEIKGEKILDLGTGSGRMAQVLVGKGAEVYGVDISKEMLEQAKRKKLGKKYKLYQGDITNLKRFNLEKFDKVISFRVLKYVYEKGKVLDEVQRVLKKNGIFLLEISNSKSFEKILRWKDKLVEGSSERYELIDFNKMKRTLEKMGFEIINVVPTTKVPHHFWRKLGNLAHIVDSFLKLVTPSTFLSRGLVIKARNVK